MATLAVSQILLQVLTAADWNEEAIPYGASVLTHIAADALSSLPTAPYALGSFSRLLR
jgi:hypothetical protein